MAAAAVLVAVISSVLFFGGLNFPGTLFKEGNQPVQAKNVTGPVSEETKAPAVNNPPPEVPPGVTDTAELRMATVLDPVWLAEQQGKVWQQYAELWRDDTSAITIQKACDGDSGGGYACLRGQGSWSKIKRLGLPVVLELQADPTSFVLLQGIDNDRLLLGGPLQRLTVAKEAVDSQWLGAYLVAWPHAAGWPAEVGRGDSGPAVETIMAMAARVDVPYRGGRVFDAAFENWLKSFQLRNGLEVDGIVGRNTLLHLMTASIEEPQLLQSWD
jgi:general secretion pathway protein A